MTRLAKALDHLLLQLCTEGDAGMPAAEPALATLLNSPELPMTLKQAAEIKEFALRCCYACVKGERLRITHIGLSRLERLYPEHMAHAAH